MLLSQLFSRPVAGVAAAVLSLLFGRIHHLAMHLILWRLVWWSPLALEDGRLGTRFVVTLQSWFFGCE